MFKHNNKRPRLNLTRSGKLDKCQDGKRVNQKRRSMEMELQGSGVQRVRTLLLQSMRFFYVLSTQGQKHYSKQTVYDAHLTSKKHVKAVAKQATSGTVPSNPNGGTSVDTSAPSSDGTQNSAIKSRLRNSALLTHLATALLVTLVPTLNETKSNVERRFSLTAREREQELLEQSKPPPPPTNNAVGPEGEEEEEEERIYNPLKLPLGWDGKPIPYWLYKLHGLGVEYRCEICSDHVYMGR